MGRRATFVGKVKKIALIIFFLTMFAQAADHVYADEVNIPLPRQGAYTGRGLSAGLAGGVFDPTKNCDCLGVWQAQGDFQYFPWLSGGIDVRFFGGDLDSDVMVMYQRYRISAKAFFLTDVFALYLSPVLGLENTSISEFRQELHGKGYEREPGGWNSKPPKDTVIDSVEVKRKSCEKMFSLDGFSVGIELGGGISLGRYFGLTGSALYEYNFVEAVQLTLTPGLAFDMRQVWAWPREKLRSMWLSFEVGFQRYFNRGVGSWSRSAVVGIQLGM